MMTSSNGDIFRVTGLLCGEFTGNRWIPHSKANDTRVLVFSLICAWINGRVNNGGWWFETPSHPLWHHCNVAGKCEIRDVSTFMPLSTWNVITYPWWYYTVYPSWYTHGRFVSPWGVYYNESWASEIPAWCKHWNGKVVRVTALVLGDVEDKLRRTDHGDLSVFVHGYENQSSFDQVVKKKHDIYPTWSISNRNDCAGAHGHHGSKSSVLAEISLSQIILWAIIRS